MTSCPACGSHDGGAAGGDAAADADAAGLHDADAEQLQYGNDHAGTGGECGFRVRAMSRGMPDSLLGKVFVTNIKGPNNLKLMFS